MQLFPALGLFLGLASAVPATPAGLALADFSRAEQIPIVLSSFRMTGKRHLKVGRPVIVTIAIDGFGWHDLTAPEFFDAVSIRRGDGQFVDNGVIRVRGDEKAFIPFVPGAGRYRMKCGHAFHKMLGMSGSIDVTW